MQLPPRHDKFCDPYTLSFTKRGELASLKQLLFLAFIESDGSPPNFSNVSKAVHPNGQLLRQPPILVALRAAQHLKRERASKH